MIDISWVNPHQLNNLKHSNMDLYSVEEVKKLNMKNTKSVKTAEVSDAKTFIG